MSQTEAVSYSPIHIYNNFKMKNLKNNSFANFCLFKKVVLLYCIIGWEPELKPPEPRENYAVPQPNFERVIYLLGFAVSLNLVSVSE
jgi:hypothetical protein